MITLIVYLNNILFTCIKSLKSLKTVAFFILINQCGLLIQRLESQLGELQTTHEQVQQEVQKLQKEGTEMKQKAKELQHSLETEKAG